MGTKFVSERNLKFLLHEVFDVEGLTKHEAFQDQNKKMYDMVVKAAIKFSKDLLFPIFEEMDRKPPELVDGVVKVHPDMRNIMKEFSDGGWLTSRVPVEHGGEGLPHMVAGMCDFIFQAANMGAAVYPGLTSGAAHLIISFGTKELQDIYLPSMMTGKWQGTMALTEPEAGSSLGDITTSATPTDDGHYLIKGQKIFISAGDHDATDNVIHLMIARVEGSPAGAKGISLFVVPKYRPESGDELVGNDVACSGVYHKLGYRGCPIVQLSIGDKDDCRGWLLGDVNSGLKYMFQMMNEARIGVGLGATALATAAYYSSLDYAKSRRQGRKLMEKDPTKPMVPIIEHADVKRMLLFQRAISEGCQGLLVQCTKYTDLQQISPDGEKEKYDLLLEVLTPIMKSYPAEMAILTTSQGLQILGGSGYCDDYPLEQYFRDCRIHPIHEGTTAVQGMDLLGRKLMMKEGKGFALVLEELQKTVAEAKNFESLVPFADKLNGRVEELQKTVGALFAIAQEKGAEAFLADATLFLEYFGIIVISWQWLLQGIAAQEAMAKGAKKKDQAFYEGKMYTLQYFFAYELPKTMALHDRLTNADNLTVDMQAVHFND
jgi:alkylation response protein AidB-like acyl-CoA dehydrogenase